jgi:uncharacterized protein YbjQ (UPF0145 family)
MTVTPSSTVPGKRITRSYGLVYGNTIRARHVGNDMKPQARSSIKGSDQGVSPCIQNGFYLSSF